MGYIAKTSTGMQGGWLGVYGPPGVCKTSMAVGFILAAWRKWRMKTAYRDHEEGRDMFPECWKSPCEMYDLWLPSGPPMSDLLEGAEMLKSGIYCALIDDTITSAARKVLHEITEQPTSDTGRTGRVRFVSGSKTINQSSQQDYGLAATAIEKYSLALLDAVNKGRIVVWLGHEKWVADEGDEGIGGEDAFGGMEIVGKFLTRNSPKLMRQLLHLRLKKDPGGTKGPHRLVLPSEAKWLTKDRLRTIPPGGIDLRVLRSEFPTGPMGSDKQKEGDELFKIACAEKAAEMWAPTLDAIDPDGILMQQGKAQAVPEAPQSEPALVPVIGPPGNGIVKKKVGKK